MGELLNANTKSIADYRVEKFKRCFERLISVRARRILVPWMRPICHMPNSAGLTVVGVVFGTLAIATDLTAFQDHMVNWAIIVVVVPAGHHCLMRKFQESLQDLKVLVVASSGGVTSKTTFLVELYG